jgi:hypothetical protein
MFLNHNLWFFIKIKINFLSGAELRFITARFCLSELKSFFTLSDSQICSVFKRSQSKNFL